MHDQRLITETPHGHGLTDDLPRLSALLGRRRALAGLASSIAAPWLLTACGGGGSSNTTAASATAVASSVAAMAASTITTTSTTAVTSTSTSTACIADPAETAGPYPADGSNAASGATSDILTASGIVRSDLRSSFLGSTTTAPGVAMTLTLTLVNTNAVCSTLQGYAIYLWHCDRSGNYSLYTAAAESYLRGVQVTDSSGQVTFTSIVPACYSGRYPHIHFEVFTSLAAATAGRNAILTSQLALPAAVASIVYANADGYSQSVVNLSRITLASDSVFGDDTASQLAAMTPTMSGSVADGFVANATIGVAR